jgi:hypothetical protein
MAAALAAINFRCKLLFRSHDMAQQLTSDSSQTDKTNPLAYCAKRESLRTDIPILDDIVTRLVGKALVRQEPLNWGISAEAAGIIQLLLWPLATAILVLIHSSGMAWSGFLSSVFSGYFCWLLTCVAVGSLRDGAMGANGHEAPHGAISTSKAFNHYIASISRGLARDLPPEMYQTVHIGRNSHHDVRRTAVSCADTAEIVTWRFALGWPVYRYWLQFFALALGPKIYLEHAARGIVAMATSTNWSFKLASLAAHLVVFGSLWMLPFHVWVWAIAVPSLIGVPLARLVHAISEHLWTPNGKAAANLIELIRLYCTERLIGLPAPDVPKPNLHSFLLWTIWWLKHLIWLWPLGLAILPGGNRRHGAHHAFAGRVMWYDMPFYVQKRLEEGDDAAAALRDAEVWGGPIAHMARTFEAMSKRGSNQP